jgi:cytidine deaminase
MANSSKNTVNELISLAKKAQANSYSPYSNFKVGAAVVTDTGNQYSGCNVENASYPESQCAEASAIGNMVSAGERNLKQIVILSPNENMLPPCGGCRQKIAEFAADDCQVHLVNTTGKQKTYSVQDLLPYRFGKDDLET